VLSYLSSTDLHHSVRPDDPAFVMERFPGDLLDAIVFSGRTTILKCALCTYRLDLDINILLQNQSDTGVIFDMSMEVTGNTIITTVGDGDSIRGFIVVESKGPVRAKSFTVSGQPVDRYLPDDATEDEIQKSRITEAVRSIQEKARKMNANGIINLRTGWNNNVCVTTGQAVVLAKVHPGNTS